MYNFRQLSFWKFYISWCRTTDELFSTSLRVFETCASVNNNLCEKIVSSIELPIKFDERFKVTSVPFFIADFNFTFDLLSCYLDNFTFTVFYWVILY